MRKPSPLTKGEKWILLLTLVFSLTVTAVYLRATHTGEGDEYSIRAGDLAQETESLESVDWLVNVNTAAAEELARLPGVGEALAERIIAYREENGPFRRAEDLMKVKGIGEGKFADMKDWIILEEEAER